MQLVLIISLVQYVIDTMLHVGIFFSYLFSKTNIVQA